VGFDKTEVKCPDCGFEEGFRPQKREIDGSRRKKCGRCGRSYLVRNQVLSKHTETREDDTRFGWMKFSKSDG
jgi:transposase-like protein